MARKILLSALLAIAFASGARAQVSVGFQLDSDWGGGANVTFTLTNTTAAAINNWTLAFDYASTISPYSAAALLSHTGNHQVLTNLSYGIIPANGVLTFQCGASPGNLGTNQPAGYIFNGTPLSGGGASLPSFSIADSGIARSDSGTVNLAFPVTLSAPATNSVSVNYSTADGSAFAGTDYVAAAGTLLFTVGTTQQVITITVNPETALVPIVNFSITLSGATNATIARATAVGTITNINVTPTITVDDPAVYALSSGTNYLTFTLALNTSVNNSVSVQVATADQTALAGTNYLPVNQTVTFAAGQIQQTVSVAILGSTNSVPAKTFALNLTNPSGLVIKKPRGTGTIFYANGSACGKAQTGPFDYAEALQKALFFYECQRSGNMPANNRVSWRGNAATSDGSDVGLDLTGGWFDAGDHVKFGLPMASSATMLAWGGIEYSNAFNETGQMPYLLDNLKWVCDYFIKCDVLDSNGDTLEFYGQVGNGGLDHAFWGPSEVMTMARPAYAVTRTAPGSDLCGETAAALAASSILFQSSDPAYASNLLSHAKKLYKFADTYRGKYSDSITDAAGYYNSWSGYQDELMWGGLWLYRATGDTNYLTKAQAAYANIFVGSWGQQNYPTLKWTHAWDDKTYGSLVLFSMLTTNAEYRINAEHWLDYWTIGRPDGRITYTPGGLAWLDTWGVLRYANNTAFLALIYSDHVNDYTNRYRNFAISQINYTLGANPQNRSFMCGFGNNPPVNPHHRGAHGSWDNNISDPPNDRHTLYGALVGGPDVNDNYTDSRSNYQQNEPACDYNAGLSGGLARMYELFGGYTQPLFPAPETPTNQFFVQASLNQTNAYFTEIRALLNNQSAWPARGATNLHYRYFVDLSELYAAGGTTNNVTISVNFLSGGSISGLRPWDEPNHIYYVELSYDGVNIIPGGSTSYRAEAQFRLTIPNSFPASAWNPANDWSYAGLLYGNGNVTNNGHIPTYENGVLLEGAEPPLAGAYQVWRLSNFTSNELANASISGDGVVLGGDGLPNLLKYALGLPPKLNEKMLAPRVDYENVGGQYAPVLTYTQNPAATDVTLSLMESQDLLTWSPAVEQEISQTNSSGFNTVKVRLHPSGALPGNLFLRFVVSLKSP